MNLFNRIRDNRSAAPDATVRTGEVLPADNSLRGRMSASGGALVDRATNIYRSNPKMVGGLAVLAGALLLKGMTRR